MESSSSHNGKLVGERALAVHNANQTAQQALDNQRQAIDRASMQFLNSGSRSHDVPPAPQQGSPAYVPSTPTMQNDPVNPPLTSDTASEQQYNWLGSPSNYPPSLVSSDGIPPGGSAEHFYASGHRRPILQESEYERQYEAIDRIRAIGDSTRETLRRCSVMQDENLKYLHRLHVAVGSVRRRWSDSMTLSDDRRRPLVNTEGETGLVNQALIDVVISNWTNANAEES